MKPLHADKTLRLTHCIRHGTTTAQYQTTLSGVSCREIHSASTGARSGAGLGFADQSRTGICIFAEHSTRDGQDAQNAQNSYLPPAAFRAADEAQRAAHWTVAPEDKVLLPSGRTGTVTSIQDNRDGRCPHWYLEVSG